MARQICLSGFVSERRVTKVVAVLLIRKIVQLFLIMVFGYILVKAHILKAEESVVLSKLSIYLITPCVILNSFQVDFTPDIQDGLILGFVMATALLTFLVLVGKVCEKTFSMNEIEKASVIYSNSINLTVPIVAYVLGEEWVIYTSSFMSVQLIFLWSHCVSLFAGKGNMNLKKMLFNPNMIAIFLGLLMLVSGLRPPLIINETLSSVGEMLGPASMLITGMVVAKTDLKEMICRKRIYLVMLMRMIASPLVVLLLIKAVQGYIEIANADKILLIIFLAVMAPSASIITQFSQLYEKDAEYAGAINILTTLSCIVTMPIFVFLYEWI